MSRISSYSNYINKCFKQKLFPTNFPTTFIWRRNELSKVNIRRDISNWMKINQNFGSMLPRFTELKFYNSFWKHQKRLYSERKPNIDFKKASFWQGKLLGTRNVLSKMISISFHAIREKSDGLHSQHRHARMSNILLVRNHSLKAVFIGSNAFKTQCK